jgi:hypothetical protein
VNQESPAPRRRSNFRAPGTVDAEALTRVFGDAAAADSAAAAEPAEPAAAAAESTSPDAEAPATATTGVPSGRRASSHPVDDLGQKRPAARPGRRRAVDEPASASPVRPASTPPRSADAAAFPWNLTPEVPSPVDHGRSSSPGNTRPRRPRHRLAVGVSAATLLAVTGLGVLAVANDVPASLFAVTGSASPPSDALAGVSGPIVTSELSEAEAPFTGGTAVTVTGEWLDEVSQVSVAGAPADILDASSDHLTFAVPATTGDAIGAAEVVFADGEGRPVTVAAPAASASAEASAGAASKAGGSSEASAPVTAPPTDSLTLTYTSDPAIDAQLAYVLAHWDDYNTEEYATVSGKDAVNFASQSLIARGWTMDDAWNVDSSTGGMSAAWTSSTALREYLLTRADRATELTDAQRDQVKIGDIAQFDWDDSGDRDHTAVVTRVERSAAGTQVWVASHTKDADYWDVDAALADGGGSVSFFSIR